MNPSQSKRLANVLKIVQEVRRSLDKEAAERMSGIGAPYGTNIDLDDAIFGVVYAEKALARIWERERFVRSLTDSAKERLKFKQVNVLRT